MDLLVWTLRLPTNVQKAVRDIQGILFRTQGLVSAVALPVLVPLLCLRTPPGFSPERLQAAERLPAAVRLHAAGLAESGGCLVCRLEPRQALLRLAEVSRSIGPKGAAELRPPPLPCAQGIFLCVLENPTPADTTSADGLALVGEDFPGLSLSLLRITGLGAPDPWWSALAWEELRRLPLRKGKPAGPASASA